MRIISKDSQIKSDKVVVTCIYRSRNCVGLDGWISFRVAKFDSFVIYDGRTDHRNPTRHDIISNRTYNRGDSNNFNNKEPERLMKGYKQKYQ